MADRSIVYDPDKEKLRHRHILADAALNYSIDADMWSTRDGITLSSAVWSVAEGDTVSVGADSESANVSTALVTASDHGTSLVKVVLTMSDGQKGVQFIEFHVIDRTKDLSSDYQ